MAAFTWVPAIDGYDLLLLTRQTGLLSKKNVEEDSRTQHAPYPGHFNLARAWTSELSSSISGRGRGSLDLPNAVDQGFELI